MRSKFIVGLLALFMMLGFSSCGYERIDAGHEGIKVNLYGSDKGVDNTSLVTGAIWYNPFTESVYEYPTFVQTVDYKPFTINAKDGSEFKVDPTISLKLIDGKTPEVFKKYRKDLDEIIEGTMYNYVKDAFRVQLNKFTTDEIVSMRDSIEIAIESHLSKALYAENFILEQLTSGLSYPESIIRSIDAKNETVQKAMKVQNEVAVAKAEAEKTLIAARAEAEANKLREQALTPAILEKMWIEKWSGEVPTVITGNNTSTFLDLDKLGRK